MEKKNINIDPMEEAYKQLDGEPAGDAVSRAAMGQHPQTAYEQAEEVNEDKEERLEGDDCGPADLEDAYAQLFGALSVIMRHK